MDSAAGNGNNAIVIRCWRGSGSLTDRAAIIVITAPSSATVSGWWAALVSTYITSREQPNAIVERVASRSRSRPGSEPMVQVRARW